VSYHHVQRLISVRQEFEAIQTALGPRLADVSLANSAHLVRAVSNLEKTYLIYLFSEFEGILRDYLTDIRPRRRIPRVAELLMDRVAGLAHIPDGVRHAAHAVRNYRNALVHRGVLIVPVISFREAFSVLSRFLSILQ
jgi:hypothetical protein